jgi:hypothetical protein
MTAEELEAFIAGELEAYRRGQSRPVHRLGNGSPAPKLFYAA